MNARVSILGAALLLLASCGGEESKENPQTEGAQAPAPPRPERSMDPVVVQLRQALDRGEVDLAEAMMEQAAPLAGEVEGPLLRARLAILNLGANEGLLEAVRLIEQARVAGPLDPRVTATATEIHAWLGKLLEAEDELRRAGVVLGSAEAPPEILRAYAITILCTPGTRPREGLRKLEQAIAADPDLPFMGRALGQAHKLVAMDLARVNDLPQALKSVEQSLEHDPGDLTTVHLKVELLVGIGEWGTALRIYEDLMLEGMPIKAEAADLFRRAGFVAETRQNHELALTYLRRSLVLGEPRENFGELSAGLLQEAATTECEAARTDLEAQDFEGAQLHLDEAKFLDPGNLLAGVLQGDLCVARAGAGDWEQAELEWQAVITTARLQKVDLPMPLHLKLAKHQALALDDMKAAWETLEAYIVLEPEGEWVEATKQLMSKLPNPNDLPPSELPGVPDEDSPEESGEPPVPPANDEG